MKPALLIFLIILSISCSTKQKEFATVSEQVSDLVTNQATELLEDERFHSVSIAVFNNGSKITRHFGELEIGTGIPPNDSSIYEIASVTKTFLGTLAAKAVTDGKINLDDDVRIYLEEPYPNLEFDGKPVTIKDLLTHTSGFPNFPIRGENKLDFIMGLHQIKIRSEIGSIYAYSNTAPELMAYILEKVYQLPYEELIDKYILTPNEMFKTTFVLSDGERSRLVKGYNDKNEVMPNFKRNLWGGTIGLHSTSEDLIKYMKFQLKETNEVIHESHKDFFETPYGFSIGYHWNIIKEDDYTIYRHHGGIYGMQNWFMICPKYNLGISVLSNSSFDDTGEILEELTEDLFEDIISLK